MHLSCRASISLAFLTWFGVAYADGTPEQRQACMQDALRLCSSEIPDVPRITACMIRNMHKLSPPCRSQFAADARTAAHPPRQERATLAEEALFGRPGQFPVQ